MASAPRSQAALAQRAALAAAGGPGLEGSQDRLRLAEVAGADQRPDLRRAPPERGRVVVGRSAARPAPGRAAQHLVRVVPGQAQDAARRGGQDRGEAAERARRLLGRLARGRPRRPSHRGRRRPGQPRCARGPGRSRGRHRMASVTANSAWPSASSQRPSLNSVSARNAGGGQGNRTCSPALIRLTARTGPRPRPAGRRPTAGPFPEGEGVGPDGGHHRRPLGQVAEQAERPAGVTGQRESKRPDTAGGVVPRLAVAAAAQRPVQPSGASAYDPDIFSSMPSPSAASPPAASASAGCADSGVPRRPEQDLRVRRAAGEQRELAERRVPAHAARQLLDHGPERRPAAATSAARTSSSKATARASSRSGPRAGDSGGLLQVPGRASSGLPAAAASSAAAEEIGGPAPGRGRPPLRRPDARALPGHPGSRPRADAAGCAVRRPGRHRRPGGSADAGRRPFGPAASGAASSRPACSAFSSAAAGSAMPAR